jgi:ADP-ribose pyrophosphatase YjhB (NUDIX family)
VKPDVTLHPIQVHVLSTLLLNERARFSALNPGNVTNDHFTFHLRQLQKAEFIEKDAESRYRLTQAGKEFANRLAPEDAAPTRQAKIGVNVVAVRKRAGRTEYLVQRRLKHPYFGFYGFITDPIRWGETVTEAAERELLRETGLRATFRVVGVEHRLDYLSDGALQEDKFFYVVAAEQVAGELRQPEYGGHNEWMTLAQIKKLPKQFQGLEETIKAVRSPGVNFTESTSQYHREDY